jgi:hypothetical protein
VVPETPEPWDAHQETAEEQEGAEQHVEPTRPSVINFLFLAVITLVLLAEHNATPRRSTTSVSTWGDATGGGSSRSTYLLRALMTSSLSLRMRARRRYRCRCRTNRNAVDELNIRWKLDIRSWRATSLAVLTGALDECVDLGDSEIVVDEVADVVGDHGTPVRAMLCMIVAVTVVLAQTLPAKVVAAALAWRWSVDFHRKCPEGCEDLQFI